MNKAFPFFTVFAMECNDRGNYLWLNGGAIA